MLKYIYKNILWESRMNDERKKANEKDKIRSRKFEYIITNHIGSIDAIKDKFGFKNKSKLSSFRNPESSDQLTSLHLLGLQEYFNESSRQITHQKPFLWGMLKIFRA